MELVLKGRKAVGDADGNGDGDNVIVMWYLEANTGGVGVGGK